MSFTQELKALEGQEPVRRAPRDGSGDGGSSGVGGRTLAQELYERRLAERRERRRIPEWFSVDDLVPEPWERELAEAAYPRS